MLYFSFRFHYFSYKHIRTEFSTSLARCIALNHNRASQLVPASPEFNRKYKIGVIMTATECLMDKRKSFHLMHTNIPSALWLFQHQHTLQPCNRHGNFSYTAWLISLAMSLVQTKRHCNLSLHSILPNGTTLSNYTDYIYHSYILLLCAYYSFASNIQFVEYQLKQKLFIRNNIKIT